MVTKALIALMLIAPLGFCSTMGGSGGSLCPLGPFIADPGAAQRLTRSEKEQIVTLNNTGEKVCGWTAPA